MTFVDTKDASKMFYVAKVHRMVGAKNLRCYCVPSRSLILCVPICVHVNLNLFNCYDNVYLIIFSRSVDAARLMAAQAAALDEYENSLLFDCSDVHKMVDLYA